MDITRRTNNASMFCNGQSRELLIIADNLGIKYEGEKRDNYKSKIHDRFLSRGKKQGEPVWALGGVSFECYAGDILGIIGPNGAGKTTLCRAIMGLLRPDKGVIRTHGEITSLLSLGTGFNNEITGRENIILNGLMLGFSRQKLKLLLPAIEDFTGLGSFLDQPLKYYSSGMKARLGFSIASVLEPDIMVVDEVFGAGDIDFMSRAKKRMKEMVSSAKTVLLVTHDVDLVEEFCTQALWLNNGLVASYGDPSQVVSGYKKEASTHVKRKKKIVKLDSIKNNGAGREYKIQATDLGIKFDLKKRSLWALDRVSFSARDKEIIGIIGNNGAGKTTLCRAISGLYKPDRGTLQVSGEITALLSLGLGFNNQLSGYDNIYLNGLMMGIPKKRLEDIEKDVIDFSELKPVIHKPVKVYSSGMRARLGFSIAAMLKPDIFIVDEALSVGDIAFRDRATNRMQNMIEDAKTVVLVTHNLNLVKKFCTRAIWLRQGRIAYDGDPKKAVKLYQESIESIRKMRYASNLTKDVRLKDAVKYLSEGMFDIADDLMGEYLKDNPNDVNVLIGYAENAERCNDYAQAGERWKRVVQAFDSCKSAIPEDIDQAGLHEKLKKYSLTTDTK